MPKASPNTPSEAAMIRVLIAEDHPLIRIGLRSVLSQQLDMLVCGEAEALTELRDLVMALKPDVIILDSKLGDGHSFHLSAELINCLPQTKVLLLMSQLREDWTHDAMQAGVHGILSKRAPVDELLKAVRELAGGRVVMAGEITEHIVRRLQGNSNGDRIARLSTQEKQVLNNLANGRTNREIAEWMGLSEKTIKNYLSNAMDKLGVSRRTEAAVYYARHLDSQEEE
jgi:two-component system, NarL family, response regulator DevR